MRAGDPGRTPFSFPRLGSGSLPLDPGLRNILQAQRTGSSSFGAAQLLPPAARSLSEEQRDAMFKLLSKRQREGRKRQAGTGELDSARPTEADETESLGSDSSLLALLDEGWFQQGAGGTGSRHSSRPSSRPDSRADSAARQPQQPFTHSPAPALSKEGHAVPPSQKASPALEDLQPASRVASSSSVVGGGLGVPGSTRSVRQAAGVLTLPQQPATPTGAQLAAGSATSASEASLPLEHSHMASLSVGGLGLEGFAESTVGSLVARAERPGTPSVGSGWDSPRSWSTSQLSLPQVQLETMDLAQLEVLAAEAAQLQQRAALAMKFARQRMGPPSMLRHGSATALEDVQEVDTPASAATSVSGRLGDAPGSPVGSSRGKRSRRHARAGAGWLAEFVVALCELVVLLGLGFVFAAVAQVRAWAADAAATPFRAAHAVLRHFLHLWAVLVGLAFSLLCV